MNNKKDLSIFFYPWKEKDTKKYKEQQKSRQMFEIIKYMKQNFKYLNNIDFKTCFNDLKIESIGKEGVKYKEKDKVIGMEITLKFGDCSKNE